MEANILYEQYKKAWFGVFVWRGDAHYHLRDVHGSRIFFRRSTAEKYAEQATRELREIAPRGFVVRSTPYVGTNGCQITGNRVSLI